MASNYFSGSYPEADVRFLLRPIPVENTPVHIKEALIQSGQKHYSEMLTHEKRPTEAYLALFQQALANNQAKVALHALTLAHQILATRSQGITLVSLARAGTPIGVLLKRILQHYFGVKALHYSISIIRDIGIDENALLHILEHHPPETLVFVDGWTGKGVIAQQLALSLQAFAGRYRIAIKPELYVLADLCGSAAYSASTEDYLIPSSILNATVSGLVSRSIIDKTRLAKTDFHGCYFYQEYNDADLSTAFVDAIMKGAAEIMKAGSMALPELKCASDEPTKQQLQEQSQQFLASVHELYGITHINLVKPGIGESTRVLLRREADALLLKDTLDPSVRHLIYLAESKNIKITQYPHLPYRAVALIKEHI
jgi:Phosphoribosyl transferase (PRTase)/PELOTA RNA binding domain